MNFILIKINKKYVLMPKDVKDFYLVHLLQKFIGISCIVFVNTCKLIFILQKTNTLDY